MNKIVSRYAKALLQIAIEKGILDKLHTDMLLLDQVCNNKLLINALKSPMSHVKKLTVLQKALRSKVQALTLDFFAVVAQRRREPLLPAMAKAFLEQYEQFQGLKRATVSTTFQLSDELSLQFQSLVRQLAPCKKVIIDQNIDPTLIAGFVLQIEGKRLDQSLRKKLIALKKSYNSKGK